MCAECNTVGMLAKRDTGAHEEQMHLAIAHSLHHGAKARKHNELAYGYCDGQNRTLTVEDKAKHLQASSAHGMAEDHFRNAASSYRQGLPKGAKEHEAIANEAAAKANKLSEKLGV
jgi:hypothetical protein